MKNLKKQLSELPNSKSEFMERRSLVQKEMQELMMNAIKKDKGHNLSKLLKPFNQRFDAYMASVVRKCKTSLCFHHSKLDEYFIINKDEECVNITKLINDYERLPLSEWIFRYSMYFFDSEFTPFEKVDWGFKSNESTFNMIAALFVQGVRIAENDGYHYSDSYKCFWNASISGQFEPIGSYQLQENYESLNELHIIMAEMNDILLKYPFEISGNPYDLDLNIKVGFNNEINLFKEYKNCMKSSKNNPLNAMILLEKGINEYLIDQLNKGIQQD